MSNKHKIVCALMITMMVVTFSGCGTKDDTSIETGQESVSVTQSNKESKEVVKENQESTQVTEVSQEKDTQESVETAKTEQESVVVKSDNENITVAVDQGKAAAEKAAAEKAAAEKAAAERAAAEKAAAEQAAAERAAAERAAAERAAAEKAAAEQAAAEKAAQHQASRQRLDTVALAEELNARFNYVDIGIDNWELTFAVAKNDSSTFAYDIIIYTGWPTLLGGAKYLPYDLQYSIELSSQQKSEAVSALKNMQRQVYEYVWNQYPGLKIAGGFYAGYYKYSTIRVGYSATRFLSWKNFNASLVHDYNSVETSEFMWDTRYDDYNFK